MLQDLLPVFSDLSRVVTSINSSQLEKLRLETNIETVSNGHLNGQSRA